MARAIPPAASVNVTAAVNGPLAVGVPESTPALDIVIPAGRPEAVHVYAGVPPEPAIVTLYPGTDFSPVVSGDVVVIDGAMTTVSDTFFDTVAPAASVSLTATVAVPGVPVGVPVIAPVLEFIESPAGMPLVTAQV